MSEPVHTDASEPPARPARAPHVLVVRLGEADEQVRAAIGDYPDWFAAMLEPLGVVVEDAAVYAGEALPYGGHYDGIILSGSAYGVRDEEPWMPIVGRWAVAMAAHTPVLAVCFGHQVVGEALGGRVDVNPKGPEWGTASVALTPAGSRDPLFSGLPDTLRVQQLHNDAVVREPEPHRFVRLAGNAHTPLQAFAAGPWLRAVQFHPELTARGLQAVSEAQGWTPTEEIAESGHGARIMENWVRHFVRRAEQGLPPGRR